MWPNPHLNNLAEYVSKFRSFHLCLVAVCYFELVLKKIVKCKLRIWSHLLKKSLMENFIFCAVTVVFFVIQLVA